MIDRLFDSEWGIVVLCAGLLALVLLPCLACSVFYNSRDESITIIVVDKSRGSENSGSDYLVWTKSSEVFKVDDALWYGHFRASDTYGQIKVASRYEVRVIGYRWPFLSQYRNIIAVTELPME